MRCRIVRCSRLLVVVAAGLVVARPSNGCAADCNGAASVQINDLLLSVEIAQDQQPQGGELVGGAVAADGRVFATAAGSGSGDGQLRVFFPPSYDFGCLVDGTLRNPGEIAIDADGAIYIPESIESGS